MRGVLYRTDDDGNTLDKPELKISALKGSNIKVYANQEAKQAALENGDIKPGDVVLSGEEPNVQPVTWPQLELDWSNAVSLPKAGSDYPWKAPSRGFITGRFFIKSTTRNIATNMLANGVMISRSDYTQEGHNIPGYYSISLTTNDTITFENNSLINVVDGVFIPYKGVNQ